MGGLERVGDLDGELEDLDELERSAVYSLGQVLALEPLHGDEVLVFVLVDLVHRADAGVIQGRCRASLALKTLQSGRIVREILGKEFERHAPTQPGVFRLVDDAHAAAAQLVGDAVVRDGLADQNDLLSRIHSGEIG